MALAEYADSFADINSPRPVMLQPSVMAPQSVMANIPDIPSSFYDELEAWVEMNRETRLLVAE